MRALLYEDVQQGKLQELLGQRDGLQQQVYLAEEEWLHVVGSIEQFE